MKRLWAGILMGAALFCESGTAAGKDKIEDAYDLFSPSGSTKSIWIWINGDNAKGRVSLFKGANPLRQKKDDGTPVMPVDKEKCKVVYCPLSNSGGEDNRAFRLGGSVSISKDAWIKVVITFIPRLDGKVGFSIGHGGGYRQKSPGVNMDYPDFGYVRYAKFETKNTSLKDPSVGNPSAWGCAKFWVADFQSKIKAQSISDPDAPVMKVMRTPMGIGQTIPVKKDKEVTITFYVRGDETFTAKK